MNKAKIYTIRLNEITCALIGDIKKATGSENDSDVIRQAILNLHRVYYKDYVRASVIQNPPRAKETLEQKEEKRKYNICEELGGSIKDKNGAKSCVYKTYELINPTLVEEYEQTIPFSMLETELIRKQYSPSRDECEKVINLIP